MAGAAQETLERLRRLILEGSVEPGERLQESELALRFGVSRTPVREALRTLSSEGLVEVLPNRGASVARWSREDLDEIYDLRSMLESYAAGRAAERMSLDAVDVLEHLCDDMERCAAAATTEALLQLTQLNSEFHRAIVRASASTRVDQLLSTVVQVPLIVRTFARYSAEALARSMSHHREIAAAIRSREPEWAATVMRSHIIAARTVLVNADSTEIDTTSSAVG